MGLQNQVKKQKQNLIAFLVVVGTLVIVAVIIIAVNVINGVSTQAEYKSQIIQLNSVNTTFQTMYSKFFSEPSSTTRTNADWDTYYAGLSTQIQTLTTTVATPSYSDPRLTKAEQDLQKALSTFSSYLTLSKSNIDMQFQINKDQSTITSDKSISAEEAGFGGGYVTANKTKLDSDNALLLKDQQIYKQQSDELAVLLDGTLTDITILKASLLAAQPTS